jgi:hypothetical protein
VGLLAEPGPWHDVDIEYGNRLHYVYVYDIDGDGLGRAAIGPST